MLCVRVKRSSKERGHDEALPTDEMIRQLLAASTLSLFRDCVAQHTLRARQVNQPSHNTLKLDSTPRELVSQLYGHGLLLGVMIELCWVGLASA